MTTQAFVSWHASLAGLTERHADVPSSDAEGASPPPFAIEESINRRIVLVRASEPWTLAVDALVVGNNEALTDRTGVVGDIFSHGGTGLEREVLAIETVRTGEACDTAGHGLTARRVVHAIGPRYREQYAEAAESALHWAYRTTLQLCRDKGLRTVALLPLHDVEKKHYPREEGCHVALRTIRRFFERHPGAIDVLLLLMPQQDELESYSRCLPLYFPRTPAELGRSRDCLSGRMLGDADGEILAVERQIRISTGPGAGLGSPMRAFTPSRGPSDMSPASASMAKTAARAASAATAPAPTASAPAPIGSVAAGAALEGSEGGRLGAAAGSGGAYEWVLAERAPLSGGGGGVGGGGDQSWADLLGGKGPDGLGEFKSVLPGPDERYKKRSADASDAGEWAERVARGGGRSGGGGGVGGSGGVVAGSGSSVRSVHSVPIVAGGVRLPNGSHDERPWWEEWMEVIQEAFETRDERHIRDERAPTEADEALEAARRAERAAHERAAMNGRSIGVNGRSIGVNGRSIGALVPPADQNGRVRANGSTGSDGGGGRGGGGGGGSAHYGAGSVPDEEDEDEEEDEEELEAREQYAKMIKRAQRSELTHVEREELVYRGGTDLQGRPSLILVASRIHAACGSELEAAEGDETFKTPRSESVALLLLREANELVGRPFVLIFLAAGLPDECGPTLHFLRTLLSALPMQVHKELKAFYMVHPTLGLRVSFTLAGIALWGKLKFVDYLHDLHEFFAPGQLLMPSSVTDENERRLRLGGFASPLAPPLPQARLARGSRSAVPSAVPPPHWSAAPSAGSPPPRAPRISKSPTQLLSHARRGSCEQAVNRSVAETADPEVVYLSGKPGGAPAATDYDPELQLALALSLSMHEQEQEQLQQEQLLQQRHLSRGRGGAATALSAAPVAPAPQPPSQAPQAPKAPQPPPADDPDDPNEFAVQDAPSTAPTSRFPGLFADEPKTNLFGAEMSTEAAPSRSSTRAKGPVDPASAAAVLPPPADGLPTAVTVLPPHADGLPIAVLAELSEAEWVADQDPLRGAGGPVGDVALGREQKRELV